MSKVYIISDLHLGGSVTRWRTQFATQEDHDDTILRNYRELITKRDTVWFLGDVAITEDALQKVADLPGYKRLILGNHDTDRSLKVSDYVEVYEGGIYSLYKYKDAWLSHAPIHPDELRGKLNIHGHCHNHVIQDNRYINACLEHTDYKPVLYQTLLYSSRIK